MARLKVRASSGAWYDVPAYLIENDLYAVKDEENGKIFWSLWNNYLRCKLQGQKGKFSTKKECMEFGAYLLSKIDFKNLHTIEAVKEKNPNFMEIYNEYFESKPTGN